MAELRKPVISFLLKYEANNKVVRHRIELYKASLWNNLIVNKYRMRVNGKWFNYSKDSKEKQFFYKTEIRDLLWRSIPFNIL